MKNYQLVISELSWSTTERKLYTLFSTIGKVSDVKLITNTNSGESLGKAFVSMYSESDAKTAARMLHHEVVDGKEIQVSLTSTKDKSFTKALLFNA